MTFLYLKWESHTRKDSLYIEMGPWVPLPIDDVSSGGDDFLGRFHIAIESVVHHDGPAPSYDSTSSAAWKPTSQDKWDRCRLHGCRLSCGSIPLSELAPVPLSIFRSNSKFDENSERSSFEYTRPITKIFCTRHDSDTVVACAKYRCDRPRIFYTRVFWIFIEFRIRLKYA